MSGLRSFVVGTIATAITFAVVAFILPKISYGGEIGGLIVVSVIAGLVNGLIKPIISALSLPLNLMTMGLFGLVINAALLLLIAWLSTFTGFDFTVADFPPDLTSDTLVTAFIGGVLMSVVGTAVSQVIRS